MRRVERPSPNFDDRRGQAVRLLVMHYTGMRTAAEALDRLTDPAAKVSAHYTIDEDGTVYVHVPEDRRAWHAGVSVWRGITDVNAASIGIELVNPGHEFGYRPFPPAQMAALVELAGGILARHAIAPRDVVGHSDVAPARKTDPGELFDWRWLATRGVGLWPAAPGPAFGGEAAYVAALSAYGYGLDGDGGHRLATMAFQRHFRPSRIDGAADAETQGLLAALLAACG
ncbi:N-acetylmuramoyl-L-alanine amidase [Parapedomonas caeni]